MKLLFVATAVVVALLSGVTAQSALACTPATIFIPVTSTITVTNCPSSLAPIYTTDSTFTVTITSTSVLTNFHTTTISPEYSPATAVTSSGGPSYFYSVVSGTTSWLNGVSPTSSVALTTATTSVIVIPLSTVPDTTIHLTSMSTLTETVTAPQYTSTIYSFAPVDLTTTSYSTVYTTISVYDATTVSTRRPSPYSIGGNSWNVTSLVGSLRPTGVEEYVPERTATMTGIFYWDTGSQTTSTSTRYLTTTLHMTQTTSFWIEYSAVTVEPETSKAESVPTTMSSTAPTSVQSFVSSMSRISEISGEEDSPASLSYGMVSPAAYPSEYPAVSSSTRATYSSITASGENIPKYSTSTALLSTMPTRVTTSGPVVSAAQAGPSTFGSPSTFPMNSTIGLYSMSVAEYSEVSAAQSASAGATFSSSSSGLFYNTTELSLSLLGSTVLSRYIPSTPLTASKSFFRVTGGPVSVTSTKTAMIGTVPTASMPENSADLFSKLQSSPQIVTRSVVSQSLVSQQSYTPGYSSAVTLASSSPTVISVTAPSMQLQLPQSYSSSVTVRTSTATNISASTMFPIQPTSATARPSFCGESGPFVLTFDDLPNFNPSNRNNTDITQAPPIPNPYRHLTFSDGYVYAPQPNEPYTPHSAPHLAVFLAGGQGLTTSTIPVGEIADGIYESSSAFWFDAHSVWLGCDNAGPDLCTIIMTGYTWSAVNANEIASFEQNTTIPACPHKANCALQQCFFPASFVGLSSLQMQAYVGNELRMFFLDDLALSWTNNTCEAGLIRQTHQ